MNKRIALIVPYFGSFKNYFSLWIKSAEYNKEIDFYIFTDNNSLENKQTKTNIHIVNCTFQSIQDKVKEILGDEIKLNSPYKLCEYKPAYGEIFSEYISSYEFWGFCDMDIIWGDISNFLTNEVLDKFDKFYFLGHLTIFRNVEYINTLYRKYSGNQLPKNVLDFKLAFSTDRVMNFDEMAGISAWYPLMDVKTYSKIDFADINYRKFNFYSTYYHTENMEESEIFEWNSGRLYRLKQNGIKEEIIYCHLQKRKMEFEKDFNFNTSSFIISPNIFSNDIKNDSSGINFIKRSSYELNIFLKRIINKVDKIFSIDFYKFKIILKKNNKKIPRYPSKEFYKKYYS